MRVFVYVRVHVVCICMYVCVAITGCATLSKRCSTVVPDLEHFLVLEVLKTCTHTHKHAHNCTLEINYFYYMTVQTHHVGLHSRRTPMRSVYSVSCNHGSGGVTIKISFGVDAKFILPCLQSVSMIHEKCMIDPVTFSF